MVPIEEDEKRVEYQVDAKHLRGMAKYLSEGAISQVKKVERFEKPAEKRDSDGEGDDKKKEPRKVPRHMYGSANL